MPGSPFRQAAYTILLNTSPGIELPGRLLGAGVHKVVHLALQGRLHEGLGDPHRNIKVGDIGIVRFAVDKVQDVGMVYPQDAHVGASAGAALFDRLGRHIEHPHEADWTAGDAAGGIDRRAGRAQAGEGRTPVPPPDLWMSAACLMASKIASMLSSTGRTKQAES